jgi:hypothetical protein
MAASLVLVVSTAMIVIAIDRKSHT